jgi:hypothetical protein
MQDETSEHSQTLKSTTKISESKQTMEHKPSCQQIKSPASPEI